MDKPTDKLMNKRTKRVLRLAFAAATAVALTVTCAQSGVSQQPDRRAEPTYLDASSHVDRRVADLMRRMTLEEKVGQMTQIRVGKLRGDCQWTPGPLREDCMRAVLVDAKVGSILSGGGDFPVPENSPRAWAEMTNAIQRFALERNRLRIPILYGADGVHGHSNVLTATMFPHQIGLGATWDPATVQRAGEITGNAMRATGVFWNFAPVSDLARDTRWGRYYETYGEDPHLAGTLAAAAVRGMQSARQGDAARLTATAKHFAGYGSPDNGHDRTPAFIPIRQLQDTILPPFQSQIDAGVRTVMANSGSVNGIPVHASRYMLTEQLRQRMGFTGVVISDWEDVRSLVTRYRVAPDYPSAIAMAVNAGVDMTMEPSEAGEFTRGLLQVVRDGRVSTRRIDEAVRRVLTLKFQLGLFERPFVDPAAADRAVTGVGRDVARRLATESMVLLRNENATLPLSAAAVRKLVVAGDTADSVPRQLGGWTIGWQGVPEGGPVPDAVTVLEGVRAAAPSANVVHATTREQAAAEARDADASILVLGEAPGAEGLADTEDPSLTAEQQSLVDAVQASGRPVIVVLLTGRPRVLGSVADASALLAGWLPGTEGGSAVADVLFGAASPSGRLPVSWPKTVGDQPMSYDQLPGTNGGPSSNYDPAYPFGHGLSYTSFSVGGLAVSAGRDEVTARFTVRNTGQRASAFVVPVYVRQPVSPVLVPERRLVGFARVELAAGASQAVTVRFDVRQLAVTPGDVDGSGRREVQRGGYEVEVEGQRSSFTVR
jgi:beta-glucosidase